MNRNVQLVARRLERVVEPERKVLVRGESLALDILAVPRDEAVRESAANVDGYAFHITLPQA